MEIQKTNILFLMTDQHRADCLGCNGNPIIKTPNLDSLASNGAVFSAAYTSTPSCTPARTGILTGLSPWNHGMLGGYQIAPRYPYELPRAMAEAGYYTFAIGKLHYHPQRNYHGFCGALLDESSRVVSPGFVSDYRQWFKKRAPDLKYDATGIGWNDYRARAYALPEELHPTRWTGDTAVKFLRKYDRDEPFFLKVSFARPHSPYDPPERFMTMYNESDMPAPHIGEWAGKFAPIDDELDNSPWHGNFGIEQARKSRRCYYGSVSFIDEQIGRIIQVLEERGWLENTLIVFTSDHGDMLGDHHHWRKTYGYEGSARIPMIVRWPASMGIESERGAVITQPVELRDVFPTFLDAAGEEPAQRMDGMSLLRLVRGDTTGWREYIDLEHSVCYSFENYWNGLTDGVWKYIYHAHDGSEQLFNLKDDPGELNDLASDSRHTETLEKWRQRMVDHLSERDERFVKDGKLVVRKEEVTLSPNFPRDPE